MHVQSQAGFATVEICGMVVHVHAVLHSPLKHTDSPHRSPGARPLALSCLAEGSHHVLSTFSEHLTAALATGLHSGHCPHHAADPLRAALAVFWAMSCPGADYSKADEGSWSRTRKLEQLLIMLRGVRSSQPK